MIFICTYLRVVPPKHIITRLWTYILNNCVSSRAERLIAFAKISRHENSIFPWTAEAAIILCHVTRESNVWRSYNIQVWWEKTLGDVLSLIAFAGLWWRTPIGPAALLQVKHIYAVFRGSIKLARCYVAKSAVCRGLYSCPRVFHNMQNWRATCKQYPVPFWILQLLRTAGVLTFYPTCRFSYLGLLRMRALILHPFSHAEQQYLMYLHYCKGRGWCRINKTQCNG